MKALFIFLSSIVVAGCLGMPEKVTPVKQFEVNRYLGKWYEIARLDHSFERGLEQVTAEYALREDGGISVTNRGYSDRDKEWKTAKGKAYFVNNKNEGYLKVSFFGPFYGSYVIFGLDQENYQYAYISGPNNSYLWLLARTPELQQKIVDNFILRSKALGFDVGKLIFVRHEKQKK
jgi:apolipoprotein D and lipocalin family protein